MCNSCTLATVVNVVRTVSNNQSRRLHATSGVPRIFWRGRGGQQIQLRTEDRENGDLEAAVI
jgi:hypothetical protein